MTAPDNMNTANGVGSAANTTAASSPTADFDLIVVGAGPGGIAAAAVAAEHGCRVCLLDDNRSPGGQIWRGYRAATAEKYPHGATFLAWSRRLERTPCEVWCGWQAIGQPAPQVLRVERDGELRDLRYRNLVLATGARERFLPFPGWTLPGVFGAGGLQALVKSGLPIADSVGRPRRAVIAGSGPLLLAVASGLSQIGIEIAAICEQADFSRLAAFGLTLLGQPHKLIEGLRYRSRTRRAPYRTGCWVKRVDGLGRVEQVTLTDGRREFKIACDWLACGFHLVPNLELPHLLGCRVDNGYVAVDTLQQSSVPRVACIGELTGVGGIDKALVEGQIAGYVAAGSNVEASNLTPQRRSHKLFADRLDRAFALRGELRALAESDTIVCRCEDVPYGELKSRGSWREAKLHTRCGMGPCQGRVCGPATEFLFGWNSGGIRPPIFPAAVSTLAAPADLPEPARP